MSDAQFYFLSDQYYLDFPDDKLMPDSQNPRILWMIPVSSKCKKFKKIEQDKNKKYGNLFNKIHRQESLPC